jgi:hypothetical protein
LNEAFAPRADLVLLLDVPPEIELARIHHRGDYANQFERPDTLARCRKIFNAIHREEIKVIDASKPFIEVFGEALQLFNCRVSSYGVLRFKVEAKLCNVAWLVGNSAPTNGQAILNFHAYAYRLNLAFRDPRHLVDIPGLVDDQVILVRKLSAVVKVANVVFPGEPCFWPPGGNPWAAVLCGVHPSCV